VERGQEPSTPATVRTFPLLQQSAVSLAELLYRVRQKCSVSHSKRLGDWTTGSLELAAPYWTDLNTVGSVGSQLDATLRYAASMQLSFGLILQELKE
jgi:hypothetical protein